MILGESMRRLSEIFKSSSNYEPFNLYNEDKVLEREHEGKLFRKSFPSHFVFLKLRYNNLFAVLHGGEVCADAGCGDVRAEHLVDPGLALLEDAHDELMHQVRM